MMGTFYPRPSHMLYAVALLALGAWCFSADLVALGVMLWALAWVIIIWLVVADVMTRRVDYLDSMSRAIDAANRSDVEKLASLGFSQKEIKDRVRVELNNKSDGMNQTRYFELPLSDAKLIPLARAVLNGQPFTERRFTGAGALLSSDEFRRLRGVMREYGLIEQVSESDARQGYKLTHAGQLLFEQVAG
jgi:hypothetical protein